MSVVYAQYSSISMLFSRRGITFPSNQLLKNPIQHRNPLNMPRLRKKVKPPQTLNPIPNPPLHIPLHHNRHIPRLRMHITTNINNPPRREGQELPQKVLTTPLPRRVDDQTRLVRRVGHVLEERGGVGGGEAGVREVVGLGVLAGGFDRVRADVDAEAGFEEWGEGYCEEAGAGVGV